MAVSTFDNAADLLDTLRGRQLLQASHVKLCHHFLQKQPDATPQQLVQFALDKKALTRFQADLVLSGNAHSLILPPYVLVDNSGSGYAGQVYQARGQKDDERYVIKILARGTRAGTPRVTQTLRRFAGFRSSAVVPITYVGTVSERTYVVWPDPVDGQTLERLVQEKGKLPPKQVVHYAIQVARALQSCHENGLFHGLFKAADVHIDSQHKVAIKDLGMGFLLTLSREDSTVDTMTSMGQLASGLDWASPESLIDQRDRTSLSDQYSLGCVLYYALTGQVPFPVASKIRKVMAHQTEEPAPLREQVPAVPARLAAVVGRLMRKAPADRYADMAEVVTALQSLLAKSSETLPKSTPAVPKVVLTTPSEAPPEPEAGSQWMTWVAPVVAGLVACLVGWLLLT
jgi:serine/threonine protein kinase